MKTKLYSSNKKDRSEKEEIKNNYAKESKLSYSNETPPASSTPSTPSTSSYSFSILKGMNYIGRVAQGVKDFYYEINPATLTGK